MNWFEEQIDSRRRNDEEALDRAYESAVSAVLGGSFSFAESEDALSRILSYYRIKNVKISGKIQDETEKLTVLCRKAGLMKRTVRLQEGWYKDAFGAFLCKLESTGEYVAVLPDKFGRYSFYDKTEHKTRRLNEKNQKLLKTEALCFYKTFPARSVSFLEVLTFCLSELNLSDVLTTVCLMGLTTLMGLLMPKLNHFLFSTVMDEGKLSLLLGTMIFIATLSLSLVFLNAMKTIYAGRITVKTMAAAENASMARMLSLPPSFFREYTTGEISSRLSCVNFFVTQVVSLSFSTVLTSLFSLTYITQIFRFAPSLVVPSLCIIAGNLLFSVYSALRQIRVSRLQMLYSTHVSGKSIETITGVQKIKMSGAEKRAFARYAEAFAEQAKLSYNPPFFNRYSSVISLAISLLGTLVLYSAALSGGVNTSEYYAFQSAYAVLSAAASGLVSAALQGAALQPSLEMIKPLFKTVPEDTEEVTGVETLSGNIEVNNVSFHYPNARKNVIDGLSLKIRAGEYVAIVGKTGCGKSTLIRLLLGFETPQIGSVYYDDRDINTLDKRALRRKIGTVMQDDKLFTGDIYSNIVICAPHLTLNDAWAAAETAGIAEDIRHMPMGMQTLISEGSGGLSGGQRQRIAIARAIAPKPSILIFDEATSALDNITQKHVSDALDALHCTRLVIAHRLSTIRHCERILVMENGRIAAEGTYEELLESCPLFAELVNRQRTDI